MAKRHMSVEQYRAEIAKLEAMHGEPFRDLALICAKLFLDCSRRLNEIDRWYSRDKQHRSPSHADRTLKQDGEE